MTLNVHDADLRAMIMLVAKTGGLNVVADDSVKGNVSISVTDVDPVRVLEIIANIKNLRLLHEADVYILTAELRPAEPMQSYVLPIKFGDAAILRKAVFKSLDMEPDKPLSESTKFKDADGIERTYTYRYRERSSNDWKTDTEDEKDPRAKRVYVNPEVNALVLYGTPTEYERVKNLLATLDVELKQVSVEARIIAIDKNATKNLGVEWMWSTVPQYPDRDVEYTPPTYNSNGTLRTSGFYKETYTREANASTGYGIIQFGRGPTGTPFEFYYGAKINALVTDGKAKILSRPNVTTIQGREAVINVGSSVPVPKISSNNTATTTEFEYRDAGIILRYTPRINADGTITATIHTEVSTPQYVEDMGAYRFNTRSADTTVTVRDGEPMIIGGLIGAEEAKSVSKIPFLGDLPILGALFRNHRKSKSESELIIFLTAHVLGNK
ncbi:MAG: pilus assembly protein PilQ [Selenomonadaceae bacterium]|nr:pilus assembly protein PilQ [Selenomonadaceae bacterium]